MSSKTITFHPWMLDIPKAKRARFNFARACANAKAGLAEVWLHCPNDSDGQFHAGTLQDVQYRLEALHREYSPKFDEVTLSDGDGEIDLHVFEDGNVEVAGIRGKAPRSKAGIRGWIRRKLWTTHGTAEWALHILSQLANQ